MTAPHLQEASRLLGLGFKLCPLEHMKKKPEGLEWNRHPVTRITPDATGYGVILALNDLCSVDYDHELSGQALEAVTGLSLAAVRASGVPSCSERVGSLGRVTFKSCGLPWVKLKAIPPGDSRPVTILELRCSSPNLQDVLPGTLSEVSGTFRYLSERRIEPADRMPVLPAALLAFWRDLASDDIDKAHAAERRFTAALGDGWGESLMVSTANGKKLAFRSRWRAIYNEHAVDGYSVADIPTLLEAHGYSEVERGRWSHPNATGKPGIRQIPGKSDLWRSDHAGDPLSGTFDPWSCYVTLAHGGNLDFAELDMSRMFDDPEEIERERTAAVFEMVAEDSTPHALDDVSTALLHQPNQDNVAMIFRRNLAGKLVFAHGLGKWLEWDGMRWKSEDLGKAFNFARDIARAINTNGKSHIASANFAKGVETFARADPAFAVTGKEFDTSNYLLNTPAGTFDLLNNVLRPHDPGDKITLVTSVGPVANGGERFLQFMQEVTGGDDELIEFHQVSLGATLSGAVESHWLLFWTGNGRNGKNTLGDLVMYILNDYARKIPSSTLMSKTHEGHPTEIATFRGIRLATASEVSEGDHWNEARINEFTGDAILTARFMRGDFFDFTRTHKHLIYGNHRPQLRSVTDAVKARIKIVPFKQSFVGREDAELPAKLKEEAGFVLHWLLDGHAKWLRAGRKLPHCAAVTAESEDYFDSQSTIEAWLSERVKILDPDHRKSTQFPKSSDLYKDYSIWKHDRGEAAVSQTRWGETMSKMFTKVKGNGFRYRGVELLEHVYEF
jgi:putative DNA primase/helicase